MDLKEISKKIKHLEIYTNRNVNEVFAGNYKSSFRGQGLEVSDLRKYEEGDDARHIDWITTAKKGKPYIKKYQETRELTTLVMIDLSASMNFTTVDKKKSEVALELVSTILFSAFKNGDKFGAILFGDKVFEYIPPKKGKSHLLRILRAIISGYENNHYTEGNQKIALDYLNSVAKRHTICFFISDELIPNSILENSEGHSYLKIANQKHDLVYVNIFDKFEKKIDSKDVLEIEDPETREIMIIDFSDEKIRNNYIKERDKKYKRIKKILNQYRIDSLEISTESNIYKELLLFFKKRSLRY